MAPSSMDTVPLGKASGASCAKVKNEWSCTSTSLICLHGMHRVSFLYCIMCVGMLCNRSVVFSIFYLFIHVWFLKLVTNFCQATWYISIVFRVYLLPKCMRKEVKYVLWLCRYFCYKETVLHISSALWSW